MKKWIGIFLGLLCLFPMNILAKDVKLYLFYGDGCPHCKEEKAYLKTLKVSHPDLQIISYEVWYHEDHATLLNQVKQKLNLENPYVPFTVIGTNGITGFSETTKKSIEDAVIYCEQNDCPDVIESVIKEEEITVAPTEMNSIQTIPILGRVDVKKVSLPLVSAILGLVDGFNPCAMWILIFLITLLMGTHDHKKMALLGSIFLLISGFVYLCFMAAWLKFTITMRTVVWIRTLIALFSIGVGLLQLKKYSSSAEIGCQVTGSEKRKTLMKRMRDIVGQKSIWLSILGICALAFSVNLIELACSAGIPMVFTQILSINDIKGISSLVYFLIYIAFYLFDDLIIFLIALKTFQIKAISNRFLKTSYLIGGLLLLFLGTLLLVKPEWVMFNF